MPPPEPPDGAHPLLLITGRTVYHFHTRTKTGRAPELQAAAPDVWVELSRRRRGRARHRRGRPGSASPRPRQHRRPGRVTDIRAGVVFVPFHYGYWDTDHPDGPDGDDGRAANELTPTDVGPRLQAAAVQVRRGPRRTDRATMKLKPTASLGSALNDTHRAVGDLADEMRRLGERHRP